MGWVELEAERQEAQVPRVEFFSTWNSVLQACR
jgi:hypothetical protein